MSKVPFVEAKYFTPVKGKRRIDFVVLHDMEMPEKGDTAESCAAYFQNPASPASAHYCVDDDSVVQCVRERDIAFHAPPNAHSIGVEHAGYANQTRDAWRDGYSQAMLQRSARLVAALCRKYDLPATYVNAAQLKAGKRGITTHRDVSKAFRQSTHTDPGPNFPIADYMGLVRTYLTQGDIVTPQDIQDIAAAVLTGLEERLADPKSHLSTVLRNNARIATEKELGDERAGRNPGQTPKKG